MPYDARSLFCDSLISSHFSGVRLALPLFATAALLLVYVYVSRSSFPEQMFTFLPLLLTVSLVLLVLELVSSRSTSLS